jgi:hypothetical protein
VGGVQRDIEIMRIHLAVLAAMFLAGCSDGPTAAVKEKVEATSPPISGRQALQYMFGSARVWDSTSEPLTIRSLSLTDVKAEKGLAEAWEVVFASETNARARAFTYSTVETGGLHKGVFGSAPETWRSSGANQPFSPGAVKIDSPEALETASKAAAEYLNKPGKRPPVNFMLEYERASRFVNPVWRVLWGGSVSSAEYTVTVDATTGKVVGRD